MRYGVPALAGSDLPSSQSDRLKNDRHCPKALADSRAAVGGSRADRPGEAAVSQVCGFALDWLDDREPYSLVCCFHPGASTLGRRRSPGLQLQMVSIWRGAEGTGA